MDLEGFIYRYQYRYKQSYYYLSAVCWTAVFHPAQVMDMGVVHLGRSWSAHESPRVRSDLKKIIFSHNYLGYILICAFDE